MKHNAGVLVVPDRFLPFNDPGEPAAIELIGGPRLKVLSSTVITSRATHNNRGTRHVADYPANIWEMCGEKFSRSPFLWQKLSSFPAVNQLEVTPFQRIHFADIQFDSVTPVKSSSVRRTIEYVGLSGQPLTRPLINGEPACTFVAEHGCGRACAAWTPFCALHLSAVLTVQTSSPDWLTEIEMLVYEREDETSVLPRMDFEALLKSHPELIAPWVDLTHRKDWASFFDLEFTKSPRP